MKKYFGVMVVMFAIAAFSASAQILKKSVPRNVFEQKIFDLCKEVGSTMDKKDSTKIAISEFYSLDGPRSPYSRFLNEAVTIELFKTKKFKILEKGRLEKVLKEQKMELNGIADGEVAKKVGKILDIKAVMAGTIIEMQNTLRINARLIDTGTGIIIAASTIEIDKKLLIPSYSVELIPPYNGEQNDESRNVQNENFQNQQQDQTQPNEDNGLTFGKFIVKILDAKVLGSSLICDISFTNTGEDETLDFASAKIPGYMTELKAGQKSFPVESISYLNGKVPNYTGKILVKKNQTGIVSFRFQNAASSKLDITHLTVLVKSKSYPNSMVMKLY